MTTTCHTLRPNTRYRKTNIQCTEQHELGNWIITAGTTKYVTTYSLHNTANDAHDQKLVQISEQMLDSC